MANWFYFNSSGEKVGPITPAALKSLAQQGLITPETVIENGNGRSIVAGKVNGLTFPESTFQPVGPNPFELPASASDPFSNSTSPFSNPAAQSPFTASSPESMGEFGFGQFSK